jgi:predicted AAA+ superfamily ATPase
MKMKQITRPVYLERIKALRGKPDIKVITGVRRCGKSELLKAFIAYLREVDPAGNVLYVDLMDLENEGLKEYHALYHYFTTRYKAGVNNYVLVDEVQLCQGFEAAINSLYNKKQYDIYITGSNAFMLSSDLATLFTGRYFELHVFPFSFAEYLSYSGEEDINQAFEDYTLRGGMAGSYAYDAERDSMEYISGVFNTIITRDLKQKYKLPDDTTLLKTADYLLDNVSNLTSPSGISSTLTRNEMKTNHVTIGNYIDYLCRAFLFYRIPRYDIRGKKYLSTIEKYYTVDAGFRFARLGRRNMDYGRLYENMVALELLRRGYKVYVGKLYQKEVDFVAMDAERKLYIQVSDDISTPKTMEREISPLLSIKDAYPKMIIARTKHPVYDQEGVQIVDLARWLAQQQ